MTPTSDAAAASELPTFANFTSSAVPPPSTASAGDGSGSPPNSGGVATTSQEPPTRRPAPQRLVAIGDVHGDRQAMHRALALGGAIDAAGAWIGGELVVVQTGDQIDRGDEDREVLDELDALVAKADAAGGALVLLNGNHEIMNAEGDLRYVTPASLRSFDDVAGLETHAAALDQVPAHVRGRLAAFAPGGPYARRLARRNVVAVVGDSVFVHGGVLPQYAADIEAINRSTRAWLRGEQPQPHPALLESDGPLWSRHYSSSDAEPECKLLAESLLRIGAARMVVGHTPQRGGITSACNDRVWRIDVGMSAHYGGPVEVLEIVDGKPRVLREPATGAAKQTASGRP